MAATEGMPKLPVSPNVRKAAAFRGWLQHQCKYWSLDARDAWYHAWNRAYALGYQTAMRERYGKREDE